VPNIQNIKLKPGTIKLVLFCLLYLVAFTGAELLTYYVTTLIGTLLYFIILLGLVIHSALSRSEGQRGLWLAFGLVPIFRICGLVMPVAEISEIYWYLIIAIPVFIGVLMLVRVLNYSLDDIGLNGKKGLIQALVAVAGAALGFIYYLILKPESIISNLNIQNVVIPALILLIATGFIEELVFRGILQKAAGTLGSWGWVYVSLVYTVLQIGYGSVTKVIFVFLVSLFFGWIVKKTGSIIGVSISHGLLNIGFFLVFPHLGIGWTIPHLF
jgi:uncharacterized protein